MIADTLTSIEKLIWMGQLKEYVHKETQCMNGRFDRDRLESPGSPPNITRRVNVISLYMSGGGGSRSARQACLHEVIDESRVDPAGGNTIRGVHERCVTSQTSGRGCSIVVPGAVSKHALSNVLIWEEDEIQRSVYYVSKIMRGAETSYPLMEKLVYALIMPAQKLKPYIEAHLVEVISDQPLRQILENPCRSGRIVMVECTHGSEKEIPEST
ncbi:hypothetical protein LIER_37334 [Lithospermum erythrorhizon]|uniref:Reverse transcriptase RNase H-like domain-containing protein n=1 Tax=Lithospermum erythrorhizon TaxID=34254 RepID=A0AAV3PMZ8_LITER